MTLDQRKIQLSFEFDASGVKPATETVKSAVRDMSTSIQQEAGRAAAGVGSIGTSVEQSSKKVDRATKSMISNLQRATADVTAVSNKASDRFERLSELRNLDKNVLAPYFAQLRQGEAVQAAATKGMMDMGLSAKQLQASMRGLPAQFTDIFVSLATGQKPIMVLLQQGGQIKDMFGGLVPAFKAMGQAILAFINPWTILAATVGTVAFAFAQGADERRQFTKDLIDTGNAAGTTANKLQDMAARMSASGGFTQGAASSALGEFIRTLRVGSGDLERFTTAAINLERVGGQSVKKTAEAFAELGKDPLKATLKLNESMNFLSVTAYEQIAALERVGDTLGAARVAQESYAAAVEERTAAMAGNLGTLERAWNSLKSVAKSAWDTMLGIGRQRTPLQDIELKIAELERAFENPAMSGLGDPGSAAFEATAMRLLQLKEEQRNLQEVDRMQSRLATTESARLRIIEARQELDKYRLQSLSKEQKAEEEILRVRQLGLVAGVNVEKIVAGIREKARDKSASTGAEDLQAAAKEWAKFYADFVKMTAAAEAEQQKLNKAQEKLVEFLKSPAYKNMPETARQLALARAYEAVATEEAADSLKEYETVWKRVQAGVEQASAAYDRETKSISDRAQKLELEARQIGLTADAQAKLAIAVRETEIVRLEALKNSDLVRLGSQEELEDIERRIAALKRLSSAETLKGAAEARQDILREWKLTGEQISQALTDSLVRGFDKGKDFFKSIGDWIVNYFKTIVARGIAQAITGALGSALSGVASASGGGGGILGAIGSSLGGGGGGLGGLGSLGLSGLGLGSWGGIGFLGGVSSTMTGAASLGGFSGLLSQGSMSAALGTAAPYLAAAYGLYRLLSGVGTGRSRGPAYQEFSVGGGSGNPYAPIVTNPGGGSWQGGHFAAQLDAIMQAVAKTAQQFGGNINPATQFGLLTSTSPDGRGAQAISNVWGSGGQTLFNFNQNGPNEDVMQRLLSTVPNMILAGLQDSDLPEAFKEYFNSVNAANANQQLLDQMLETAAAAQKMAEAFKQLDGPFLQLTDLSVEARSAILAMTGGLEQFLGKATSYFNNFYTDVEKQALSLASVDKTLTGVGIDTSQLRTKEDFRALVESLDLSKESDRERFAALMNSAEAFAFGAELLSSMGISLAELTANAPETAGVDLMVATQATTNSLLERIEVAIRESADATVAAIDSISVASGGGGSGMQEVTNLFGVNSY